VKFFKAHGLGNDYLVAETGPLDAGLVRAVCDRHRGIGADGILEPLDGPDHPVRIWNPDGSVAEKSGNGLRIFAWFLAAFRGAPASFTVTTAGERVPCLVTGNAVALGMGRAEVGADVSLVDDLVGCPVSVGNPHCVVWREADEDLDAIPWRRWGAAIEVDPLFPGRTNVQFARVRAAGADIRIWERGAGPTLASGSSACAVAASAVARGHLAAGRLAVTMPGGTLTVDVTPELDLTLTGPVEPVGWFDVHTDWLQRHLPPKR